MTPAPARPPDPSLQAALLYASLGWPVFPIHSIVGSHCSCAKRGKCDSPGKHPRTPNGHNDAATDEATIRKWWAEWPSAHVGVRAGLLPSGRRLVVLDVDGTEGADTLTSLEAQYGALPETVWCFSGSGGKHLYFESDEPLGNSVKVIGPGVDVRCDGGYVVAPPSGHLSGGVYRWDSSPQQCQLASWPAWLQRLAARKRQKRPGAVGPDAVIGEGGRDNHLFALGARLRGGGSSEAVILVALLAENAERCRPPLDEADIKRIAWSAARYEANAPLKPIPQPVVDPATGEVLDDWRARLSHSRNGIANTLANAVTILGNDDAWRGVLAYDAFADKFVLQGNPPWDKDTGHQRGAGALDNEDYARVAIWLDRNWSLRLGINVVAEAVRVTARRTVLQPVQAYLEGLTWDGTPRLDSWLATYLKAEASDYTSNVGRWWLIAGAARALKPGCKADCMLILEGLQGTRKSQALRVLFNPWFTDELPMPGTKDSYVALRGVWGVEWPELTGFTGKDASAFKAFFSKSFDRYRPPYGRDNVDYPRACIFAGTSNHEAYLQDETGNRRFWPVYCGAVDLDALARDRDQLWAEAVHQYRGGATWWASESAQLKACETQQLERLEADAWDDKIAVWLKKQQDKPVTTADALEGALKLELGKWGRVEQNRVGRALVRLGRVRAKARVDGVVVWAYVVVPGASA